MAVGALEILFRVNDRAAQNALKSWSNALKNAGGVASNVFSNMGKGFTTITSTITKGVDKVKQFGTSIKNAAAAMKNLGGGPGGMGGNLFSQLQKIDQITKQVSARLRLFRMRVKAAFRPGGAGATALAAGFLAIESAIRMAIAAAIDWMRLTLEQEQAERKLEAVLRATGNQLNATTQELTAFATELARTSAFADKDYVEAMAKMATFTNIGKEQFREAIVVAGDLSSLMGNSLPQAALQLGRALNDPASGIDLLTQSGIAFTKQQKEIVEWMHETNRTAEAQAFMIEELGFRFGGTAKAIGGDAMGAFRRLNNIIVDVKERIGEVIAEALQPFFNELSVMGEELLKNEEFMEGIKNAAILFGEALKLTVTTLTKFFEIMGKLVPLFNKFNDFVKAISLGQMGDSGDLGLRDESELDREIAARQERLRKFEVARHKARQANLAAEMALEKEAEQAREDAAKARMRQEKDFNKVMRSFRDQLAKIDRAIFETNDNNEKKLLQSYRQRVVIGQQMVQFEQAAGGVGADIGERVQRAMKEEQSIHNRRMANFEEWKKARMEERKREEKAEKERMDRIKRFRNEIAKPEEKLLARGKEVLGMLARGEVTNREFSRWLQTNRPEQQERQRFSASFVGLSELSKAIQASAASDPILDESKKQTKELKAINKALDKLDRSRDEVIGRMG